MSYMTEILLQVRIPKKKIPAVRADLEQPSRYKADGLRLFLSVAALSTADTLEFRASGHDFDSEYCEDDENLLLALKAPWSDFHDIAAWVAGHATRGSRMFIHSLEGDGNEFGYQFDGSGRFRSLLLRPSGKWLQQLPSQVCKRLA